MLIRCIIAAVLLLTVSIPCVANVPEVVYVQFEFDRNACGRFPGRVATEGRLSGQLQPIVAAEYKFVEWRAAPADLRTAVPRLKVVLKPNAAGPGTEFLIEYWRYVNIDLNGSIVNVGSSTPLYRADEPDRAHPCKDLDLYLNPAKSRDSAAMDAAKKKAEGFVARLLERVKTDISAKRDELVKRFFNYVPLTHGTVTVDKKHGKSLVLDVSWAGLYASPGSVIELKVNEAVRGTLEAVGQHDDVRERADPFTCARIKSFDNPDIKSETQWTQQIADKLSAELARLTRQNLEVVFEKYDPDPDTTMKIVEMRKRLSIAATMVAMPE